MPTSRVARVRGEERYDNLSQGVERIADKIDLSNKQHVLVKPNFVVTHRRLAATHVDGVSAMLDFPRSRYHGPITVADGPAAQPAAEGFRLHGYAPLADSHGTTFADLNHDGPVTVEVYDWRLRPLGLHLALASTDALPADLAQIKMVGNATLADCAPRSAPATPTSASNGGCSPGPRNS